MEWQIDDSRPIWMQLSEQLTRRIVSGQYPKGTRLPSVRELAAEAGVNPNTMQRALQELESRGLLQAQRTAGRTVTADGQVLQTLRRGRAAALASEFLRQMKALGLGRAQTEELLRQMQEEEMSDE